MGVLIVEPTANDDMVEGYMDGRNLDSPEPSNNRSRSYCHGFKVGRNEKLNGEPLGSYDAVVAQANETMRLDYLDQNRMLD